MVERKRDAKGRFVSMGGAKAKTTKKKAAGLRKARTPNVANGRKKIAELTKKVIDTSISPGQRLRFMTEANKVADRIGDSHPYGAAAIRVQQSKYISEFKD